MVAAEEHLGNKERAEELLKKAKVILMVTHGEDHPMLFTIRTGPEENILEEEGSDF